MLQREEIYAAKATTEETQHGDSDVWKEDDAAV